MSVSATTERTIVLPTRAVDIVREIVRFTDLPEAEVRERVRRENDELGWNVGRDCARFGVTPHRHDERMDELYLKGDGFIFESLCFWARPTRQKWIQSALERIERLVSRVLRPVRILMLGDGTANDALYLVSRGHAVDWFEVPGSVSYDFAARRLGAHGLLGNGVTLLSSYASVLAARYDVVVCFEVLEHLPDPKTAIRDIGRILDPGGIALVTEAFRSLDRHLLTHLASNGRFAGRTPFLFLDQGLQLTWHARHPKFKPMEFTKSNPTALARLRLLADPSVLRALVKGQWLNRKNQRRLTNATSSPT